MKHLLTSIVFFFLSLATFGQMGIDLGVSGSTFGGGRIYYYQGLDRGETGINTGVYYEHRFSRAKEYKIKGLENSGFKFYHVTKSRFGYKTGIYYQHLGGKNPDEGLRKFSTYHIHVPLALTVTTGDMSYFAGGYVNRMIYARNNQFNGPTFGWPVQHWDFYRRWTKGFIGGIALNLGGDINISLTGLYSTTAVRTDLRQDPKYFRSADRALLLDFRVPFKVFFE